MSEKAEVKREYWNNGKLKSDELSSQSYHCAGGERQINLNVLDNTVLMAVPLLSHYPKSIPGPRHHLFPVYFPGSVYFLC
jgi:hypothetical protein